MKYLDKEKAIISYCRGKSVLHLGAVGFTDLDPATRISMASNSLHKRLSEVADVLGIDYSKDVIEQYKSLGIFNNIAYGNVERLDDLRLNRTFDVIVAGDIIEHLGNPMAMLSGMKKLCHPQTIVIITTPNAFGVMNFVRYAAGMFREGNEHFMMFNSQNIQNMSRRSGFRIIGIDACFQPHARRYSVQFSLGKLAFNIVPKFGGTLFVTLMPSLAPEPVGNT